MNCTADRVSGCTWEVLEQGFDRDFSKSGDNKSPKNWDGAGFEAEVVGRLDNLLATDNGKSKVELVEVVVVGDVVCSEDIAE
jgi:hypothetical protein